MHGNEPLDSDAAGPEPVFAGDTLVHVVRQYKPSIGGLEDFVASLAARQKDRFKRIRIVTCDEVFRGADGKLPAHEVIDGIEIERLPYFGSPRYPVSPRILSAIRDADLVHVHAVDFFFDALAFAAPFHGKPMVATTHGGFFHSQDYRLLKQIWFRTVTRLTANRYSAVACCSQSDYEKFSEIAPSKVRLIENGVDLGKFGDCGSRVPRRSLVTIGRLAINKRVDLLLDAMADLSARDDSWTLDIIGTPFDWSAEDVMRMIAARGLTEKVQLHIGPSDAQIRDILARNSLFVSASAYEGFGIALIEAMSAGLTPVVQRNAAFSAFAARHEGISLCDFTDPATTARLIEKAHAALVKAPAAVRAQVMGVADTYSWAGTARRYEDLYRDVTGR